MQVLVQEEDNALAAHPLRVKFTLDARVVSNDCLLHTEMMLVLLQNGALATCQQPLSHFSNPVYRGKDNAAGMQANLHDTVQELQHLALEGLQVGGISFHPEFVLGLLRGALESC